MSQYDDMPDPVQPTTPRRTSEAARIARALLAHPDARLLSYEQADQLKVYARALNLIDQQVEDTVEGELRTLGNRNPATILSMIEHRLKSYRVQVEHKNNVAAAEAKAAAAAKAEADAMAAAALQQATAPPLRAGLRSGDDPKQRMAAAVGVLRVEAEGLKKAITKAKDVPILRAAVAVERAMETIRRVVDNGGLTPEESQQSSKEASQVYEDVMALRDNLAAAREEEELQETLEVIKRKPRLLNN